MNHDPSPAGRPATPPRHAIQALALALGLAAAMDVSAWEHCARADGQGRGGALELRWDNDAFGNAGQDHGYSNGLVASAVSADLAATTDPACLGWLDRRLAGRLPPMDPGSKPSLHRVLLARHEIYTPDDKTRTDLIEDDRPYAGALLLGVGRYLRQDGRLQVDQWRLGMVGPSARGQQVQDAVHRVIGVRPAQGWQHQLRDEPVLQWIHERVWRWPAGAPDAGWSWDAIGHAGGSLGNFATHANAGIEWRWGWQLPDDFGSTPLRPGQGYAAVAPGAGQGGWYGHLFVSVDGRGVLRDITLDGNTFTSSHRVDKRPWVADLGYGLVLGYGRWRCTLAQYQRSREFDGQLEPPSFGTLSLSRSF